MVYNGGNQLAKPLLRRNTMLQILKDLVEKIEAEMGEELPAEEIAFLETIQTVDDLRKQEYEDGSAMMALAYSAAVALGENNEGAMVITGEYDPNWYVQIELHFQEGEYLSGHTLFESEKIELLEKIGLGRYVEGWGFRVNRDVVDALGTSFGYQNAVEFARPMLDAKKRAKQAEADRLSKAFGQAKETGEKVQINHYMSQDCNDPECGLDSVTVYAMPDGSTMEYRSHTY
jgi:hypothetical protein